MTPQKAAKKVGGRRVANRKQKKSDKKEHQQSVETPTQPPTIASVMPHRLAQPQIDQKTLDSCVDTNMLLETLESKSFPDSAELISDCKYCTSDVANQLLLINHCSVVNQKLFDTPEYQKFLKKRSKLLYVRAQCSMFDQICYKYGVMCFKMRTMLINFQGEYEFYKHIPTDKERKLYHVESDETRNTPTYVANLALTFEIFKRDVLTRAMEDGSFTFEYNEKMSRTLVLLCRLPNLSKFIFQEDLNFVEHPIMVFYLICIYRGETYQPEATVEKGEFLLLFCKLIGLMDKSVMEEIKAPEEAIGLTNYVNNLDSSSSITKFKIYLYVIRWVYLSITWKNILGQGDLSNTVSRDFEGATEVALRLVNKVTH